MATLAEYHQKRKSRPIKTGSPDVMQQQLPTRQPFVPIEQGLVDATDSSAAHWAIKCSGGYQHQTR